MRTVRRVALAFAVVAVSGCGSVTDRSSIADDTAALPTMSVEQVRCPGSDPLDVAVTFITAIRDGDPALYGSCLYQGSDQDPDSLLSQPDWVTTIQSGDYRLDDEFERLPHMFSFGSPDLPPCTCSPSYFIDPNGRADVTVTLEADGLYYVTKLGIEVHG